MWDLPGPRLEPMSPALAGGFSTTMPPGKSPPRTFLEGTCHLWPLRPCDSAVPVSNGFPGVVTEDAHKGAALLQIQLWLLG